LGESWDLPLDLIDANLQDRYSYVRNCPTRYTDPSGYNRECTNAQKIGAAVLIVATDLFVGLPLFAVIVMSGVASPPAIAAEILETVVVTPINFGTVLWLAKGCPKLSR
jgi:hypothetical protein